MGSVAILRCGVGTQFRLHQVATVEASWREQPVAENRRGHEIDQRDAGPHQRSRALLIFHDRKAKVPRHGKVRGVGNTVREHKKSAEDVARQRGKDKVQEGRPFAPRRDTRPRLNNRQPEKETRR